MKTVKILLLVGIFIANAAAKPTFDVIADIIHDLVHDPNPGPPQYTHNSGYNRPDYTHVGYGYNQRSPQAGNDGFHSSSLPSRYYKSHPHAGYYSPYGIGSYAPDSVYDNQGYYKGPPYSVNQPNGYNYDNGLYRLNRY